MTDLLDLWAAQDPDCECGQCRSCEARDELGDLSDARLEMIAYLQRKYPQEDLTP